MNAANVACRQMGCGPASSIYHHYISYSYHHYEMTCSGDESSLADCQSGSLQNSNGGYSGVQCAGHPVRLVGPSRCSGRVEIYYNGAWGTVCDNGWDMNDAQVVCNQLGCGQALAAPHSAYFGKGMDKIWVDNVNYNLVRLAGSNEPCSRRDEVYYNGVWGTVCDDGWDLNDAEVVCRQLGCGPALRAPQIAYFGQGTGQIWLDNLVCSGNEASLGVCGDRGFGTEDCGHSEDAGVICSSKIAYV
ncbi:scavenger receptor cysteine-rich domain-containing group B protein-like [Anableps anableps]